MLILEGEQPFFLYDVLLASYEDMLVRWVVDDNNCVHISHERFTYDHQTFTREYYKEVYDKYVDGAKYSGIILSRDGLGLMVDAK